jgi:hypothetical protein
MVRAGPADCEPPTDIQVAGLVSVDISAFAQCTASDGKLAWSFRHSSQFPIGSRPTIE